MTTGTGTGTSAAAAGVVVVDRSRLAIVETSVAPALVAAGSRGLLALFWLPEGDSEEALGRLRAEHPGARWIEDAGFGRDCSARIEAFLSGDASAAPELDPNPGGRASAFRLAVWEALRGIPAGATRTYAELARAAGRPGAARAAGSACGANPVSLFVPCHRALRGDGALGGYRWGTALKRELLAREARASRASALALAGSARSVGA